MIDFGDQHGLFDFPVKPLPAIRPISVVQAKRFIETWHYSKRAPTGKNLYFGWFNENDLCAVADYGIGINPYQARSLTVMVGESIEMERLLELKRLCRAEPKDDGLPLTKFIARCHRLLRQQGYRYIVSFSDPAWGHTGGIYKAANFRYLGKTNAETHCVEADGTVRHRRYYLRYARRNRVDVAIARERLGLTLIKTPPKDRWFIKI